MGKSLNIGIIYKATNLVNKKIYIGQTWRRLSDRIWAHKNCPGCAYFHQAILKYGSDKFKWEIIFKSSDQKELDEEEKRLINLHQCRNKKFGYNLREGGSYGKFNIESKEKMRNSALNYFKSKKARKKHGLIQRKRFSNFEERVKHSRAHGGKSFYARKENILKIFQTQPEAAAFFKCGQGSIKSLLQKKQKEIKGWILSYEPIEKYEIEKNIKMKLITQKRLEQLKNFKESKGWAKKLSELWGISTRQTYLFLKKHKITYPGKKTEKGTTHV